MRRSALILGVAAMLLAGCGGSYKSITGEGIAPTSTTTPPPTTTTTTPAGPTVSTMAVATSNQSIAGDGSVNATITAVAKDSNNNFIVGATVTFAATAGGLAVTQATTDANGQAVATLTAAGAAVGTAITVTAASGGTSGKVVVNVVAIKQSISLLTSAAQIPSDVSKAATITAFVRDANNDALAGVAVSFQATSGRLVVTQATTDANGTAVATLDSTGDFSNRLITVTASTGSASATVPVNVIGTTLTLSGPQNLVEPGVGSFTVALLNAGNVGISGTTVALASSHKNILSAASVTTDATGHASFTLTSANSGNDTITATALGITATQAVAVSNQNFAISAPGANANINLGAVQPVTVVWTSGGAPVANQAVTFTSTRGALSAATATTNAAGMATVSITSTESGPAVITASASGVSTSVTADFIATMPTAVAVQASPATIATGAQSTITAVVRDANSNLVEGQTVNFTLTDTTGGALSVASSPTNNQGVATTVYTASSATSATNGVSVAATLASFPNVTGSAALTVAGRTVFLSLGTGNTINIVNAAQYSVTYAVQAIDGAGNGVDGVAVSLTTESVSYYKGYRYFPTGASAWTTVDTAPACASEDLNNNGILDPGEDFNGNGKLDPGAVASVAPGSVTTANGGNATVTVTYPKDHAYYVTISLTATASVQGTQASTSTSFLLAGAASDFSTQSIEPPGPVSPYGQATSCANPN